MDNTYSQKHYRQQLDTYIILIKKHTNEAILIGTAVPNTHKIIQTYHTKISIEIKAILNLEKILVLPLVTSNVGVVPNSLVENLK